MMQQRLNVEELCRKLKPIFGKRIDDVYLKYAMAESGEEREEIAHLLNALYHKHLGELLDNKVLLEPPKIQLDGNYDLGKISYGGKQVADFNLREKDWPRHVCISGMSGSGKTNLAINLVKKFIEQDKPFLIFDWKKSFRPLLLADGEVMCFTVGNEAVSNLFKININEPPKGISPKEWINVLCDLLVESFSASFGVHKVLLETLDEAFKQWGVYEGTENYPTWENIKWYLEERLEKSKGREGGWIESALRIASILTFGNFGTVCNSKDEGSLSIEDILDKKVILELNALSNIEKKFFCEFLLTYIYKMKKVGQNKVSSGFDHAIVVDEAHNIFLKSDTHFVKESVTDMIYREMREYGTSLVCLDQHISKLSDTVKGNSACHIAFQQQLPQDIFDISGIMQLREQRQFFSMLPVGSAIVKLSERYTNPFLIEIPKTDLRENSVGDLEVQSRASAMIGGLNFEKEKDVEFNKRLVTPENAPLAGTHPKPVEFDVYHDRVDIKDEIKDSDLPLDGAQKILYRYIQDKLKIGKTLPEIENELERVDTDKYDHEDIWTVINFVLKKQLSADTDNVVPLEERNIYNFNNLDLTDEQKAFLVFLKENHDRAHSTVHIYKELGLSSRKGNKIKNELLDKSLIIVKEEKNDKGWKKIIVPAM